MNISRYFKYKFHQVVSREHDMLTKARIRILAQSISAFIFLCGVILIFSIANPRTVVAIRMTVFFLFFITSLALLLSKAPWKAAAHVFLVCITLLIWSNALIFRQGVTMITVQYTILIITGGYYILGAKWGLIYSLSSVVPVTGLVVLENFYDYRFPTQQLTSSPYVFIFVLTFNFVLLIYIHYHFFKAFRKTNKKERELKQHLQKALKVAQELAEAKSNFLSTMSHELRTPLNAVIGMANVLSTEKTLPGQSENLEILRFSAENLMVIINDILDFNKIDAGKITLENYKFKPGELLRNVFGAFKARAEAKSIEFTYIADHLLDALTLTGDAGRLTQILFNLIGNAVKFTQSGYVRLIIKSDYSGSDTINIHFTIEDSGIGIPKDIQAEIFDPYIQASAKSNRQYHGTGLGLTIVSRLVALHGSELHFVSKECEGTTFSFELSYQVVKTEEDHNNSLKAKTGSSMAQLKVLIAEDNAVNVLVLKKLLKNWDIIPEVVVNGQQAVDAYESSDYDVILMDINMPVMDGFEAAKIIKERAGEKGPVRIIAVTASVGSAVEQLSGYQYLDDYLLKPFDPQILKEKLEYVLKMK